MWNRQSLPGFHSDFTLGWMAADRPRWLAELSTGFKRHRQQRSGWFLEVMRDRLRVVSSELPPRPDEPADTPPKHRAITLSTPPGPTHAAAALAEACALFDAVMEGCWSCWRPPQWCKSAGSQPAPLTIGPAAGIARDDQARFPGSRTISTRRTRTQMSFCRTGTGLATG